MATLQPALARSSAMARPMRRAAPVISTVLAVEVIRFMGPGRGIEVVSAVRTPETGRTYHAALQSDAVAVPEFLSNAPVASLPRGQFLLISKSNSQDPGFLSRQRCPTVTGRREVDATGVQALVCTSRKSSHQLRVARIAENAWAVNCEWFWGFQLCRIFEGSCAQQAGRRSLRWRCPLLCSLTTRPRSLGTR